MNIKKLLAAAAIAVGAVAFAGGAATATQPPDVHHPEDECNGTFIKSQPPGSGFEVTVAYTGNMWIKIATQHVAVPVVTKGDVITPKDLSGWPTNKRGKYQEISHVDYCVPTDDTTTTTEPEDTTTTTVTEETTTTVGETTTTVAETTTTVADTTTTVAETTTTVADQTTTTGPTTTVATSTRSLPDTGNSNWALTSALGAMLIALGGGAVLATRRK